jgi:hypothetical protein
MAIDAASTDTAALTRGLNQVLADSYALLSLTHLAQWNGFGRSTRTPSGALARSLTWRR